MSDHLERLLRLAWESGRGGRPSDRAVTELMDKAVTEQVAVPTREEWRREQARRKFEANRGLSQRRLARLCRVNRRTIEKWCSEPVATAPEDTR